jgi:hypothetical protein
MRTSRGLTPPGKGRERGWPEAVPYVKRPLDRTVRLGSVGTMLHLGFHLNNEGWFVNFWFICLQKD